MALAVAEDAGTFAGPPELDKASLLASVDVGTGAWDRELEVRIWLLFADV